MSLFYNRDKNITGVTLLTGLTFSPEYGSSVQFEAKNNYLPTSDKIQSIAPLGLNSIVANYSLKFSLRKDDAQKLINFYESQSGTGIFGFNDGSNIYRVTSGTIDSLGGLDSSNNGRYNISLNFNVERNAPALNWSGQSFINHEFKKWQTGQGYSKYDIVWFEHDFEEPINNWFYSLENHTANLSNHPLSAGNFWTTNLFEDSNESFSFNQTPSVKKTELKGSFVQRVNEQKNIHSFDQIDISYKNISDKKTKALLHFAESKLGYKRFECLFPEIYNRPKLFVCHKWNHQWNSLGSNNLTLSLIEDPLGVSQNGFPCISITQQSGNSVLNISVTGSNYCFYQTGDSKQLILSTNLTIPWNNTGQANTLKLFGPIVGLTGTGQNIIKSRYDVAKSLTHLNVSGNSISVANLYLAPNLVDVNYANNNVGGFDFRYNPNLREIRIQNNNATYFGLSNCSGVTGIYATGNLISGSYVGEALGFLYSGGAFSGFANFSGNGEISNAAYNMATGLVGRNWNLGYQYNPYIEATTTPEPQSNPTTYSLNANAASDAYSACNLGSSYSFISNANILSSATKINYSSTPFSGDSAVFLSDGTNYYLFNKTCCGKGSLASVGLCSIETSTTTTEPPEPTTTTTTTEEPSTTTSTTSTTENPCIYGCLDPSAINYDPGATCDSGGCIYP